MSWRGSPDEPKAPSVPAHVESKRDGSNLAAPRLQVFLNVPYDRKYEPLFLAAIAGLCGLGLRPRAVLELPPSQRRLSRILRLLRQCRYSMHDLSRVETTGGAPRFNMPFELGLTVGLRRSEPHDWWILEAKPYRLQKSLSDLNGTDPLIHNGRPARLLQLLDGIFTRPGEPDIPLAAILDPVLGQAPAVHRRYGGIYTKAGFSSLVYAATTLADTLRKEALDAQRGV